MELEGVFISGQKKTNTFLKGRRQLYYMEVGDVAIVHGMNIYISWG